MIRLKSSEAFMDKDQLPILELRTADVLGTFIVSVCVCVCVCQCMCVHSVTSIMSDSATPWTIAHQAPLSMGFSGQEYCSGLLFPPPENLPDPGIKPKRPALRADSSSLEPSRKSLHCE